MEERGLFQRIVSYADLSCSRDVCLRLCEFVPFPRDPCVRELFLNVLFQFSFTITFRVAQWLMYIRILCVDLCVESLLRYYVNHYISLSPICC